MPQIDLTGVQQRNFTTRSATVTDDGRTITAIGVPYGVRTELVPGVYEEFMPGSVTDEGAILRYQHRDPIGRITESQDVDEGREITATISRTSIGDDVATLVADQVLTRMSIGFYFDDFDTIDLDDGAILYQHKKCRAIEYSVVEFPAYDDAKITDVRHHTERTTHMPPTTTTVESSEDMTELRSRIDDLERSLALAQKPTPEPVADTRSLGDIVKAIADRDDATIAQVNRYMARDYDGGKIADDGALKPKWVKDLTRIINDANPLSTLFARASLPAEGMYLEYTQLKSNTLTVGKQLAEGDALPKGNISVETKTAKVETFGGASTLSFQEIQRARTNMVSLTLKAMGIAAAKEAATQFHTFLEAEINKRIGDAITVTKAADAVKWPDLLAMVLDAAKAYQDIGMALDGAIVNRDTFLALGSLTGADDRPLMQVTGTGTNIVGYIDGKHLRGELAGITLTPDFDSTLTQCQGTFYNSEAVRVYTSGIGHLQDENILNLTRDMAVYYYAAHAAEIPAALVPIKFGAAGVGG